MTTTLPADSTTDLTPRQRKALALIESGAVSLLPGRKWAVVKGSGRASYQVSRAGCSCQDWAKRGIEVGPCKHMQATRALCAIAKLARAEARETGRCTLPAPLARALANGTRDQVERARKTAELAEELFGTGA